MPPKPNAKPRKASAKPGAKPGAKPSAKPGAKPSAKPSAKPRTPSAKPGAKARKPTTKRGGGNDKISEKYHALYGRNSNDSDDEESDGEYTSRIAYEEAQEQAAIDAEEAKAAQAGIARDNASKEFAAREARSKAKNDAERAMKEAIDVEGVKTPVWTVEEYNKWLTPGKDVGWSEGENGTRLLAKIIHLGPWGVQEITKLYGPFRIHKRGWPNRVTIHFDVMTRGGEYVNIFKQTFKSERTYNNATDSYYNAPIELNHMKLDTSTDNDKNVTFNNVMVGSFIDRFQGTKYSRENGMIVVNWYPEIIDEATYPQEAVQRMLLAKP